ncbi:hypothetical protein ACFQ12_09785, partial [Methylobacterium trifolii]
MPLRVPHRRAVLQGGLALALTGRAVAAPVARASAAAFVDSVGVNVHISSEPYASRFTEVAALLGRSGIRHLRDEIRPSNDLDRWRMLYDAHGIRANLLVSPVTNTPAEMLEYLRMVGPQRVSAIEGQNEGDSDWFMAQPAARPRWHTAVVAYQRAAYRALRSRYDAATLPMLSPSIIDYKPADVALIRESAPFCDAVAIHSYVQHGQEPETGDDYAGLGWYLRHMRDAYRPGAPAVVTEVGYNNFVEPDGSAMSETASGIYLPRLLLNNFAAGIGRTFLYEFMDGATGSTVGNDHWGLVHTDGTPKPAYEAILTLLGALAEQGGGAPAAPLTVSLPDAGPDLRSLALA